MSPPNTHLPRGAAQASGRPGRGFREIPRREMPKRALTGYFVFASEKRDSVAGELRAASENASVPAVSKQLGQLWRDMPDDQRDVYKAKAAEKQKEQVSNPTSSPHRLLRSPLRVRFRYASGAAGGLREREARGEVGLLVGCLLVWFEPLHGKALGW